MPTPFTHQDRRRAHVPLPPDVHKAVVRLVVERGYERALVALQVGAATLDEARTPQAMVRPKTLGKLRERLVALGVLAA
jgi:hypothetical protein